MPLRIWEAVSSASQDIGSEQATHGLVFLGGPVNHLDDEVCELHACQ